MNSKVILAASLMAVFVVGTLGASSVAFAQVHLILMQVV
jgi:hypothetical protein